MANSTRIRYRLNGSVYESTQLFISQDASYLKAVYDPEYKNVTVYRRTNTDTYTPVLVEPYTTLVEAKKKLKGMLKKLGVAFLDELRRKNVV